MYKQSTLINNFQDIVKFVQFSFFKKRENQNDLDLFLNGPYFMRNGILISVLFIKAIYISFSPRSMNLKDVRESIDSDDTNLNNFGLMRAKNVGPKNTEYLSKNIIEHL